MKYIILICVSVIAISGFSQSVYQNPSLDGCFKQIHVEPEYATTQQVLPSYTYTITPAVYQQKEVKVVIKEEVTDTKLTCSATGQEFKLCTTTIPAEYMYYTIWEETVPAVTVTIPSQVITVKIKVRDGYMTTVPCNY
jgi:hypothetical protein